MKKVILWAAVFGCLLALCSCSGGNTEESKTSTTSETESKVSIAENSVSDESIVSTNVSNNTSTESTVSEFSVDELADWELVGDLNDYYFYKYIGDDKVVTIPEAVGSLCPRILQNDNVEEIIIPATVESVVLKKEDISFWGCKNLKKVTVLNPDFNFQIDTSLYLEMFGLETYQYDDNYVREITIVGYKGSTAEKLVKYANKHTKNGMEYKLTFEAIEE